MLFTVELWGLGRIQCYRLQDDGSWRNAKPPAAGLMPGDFRATTAADAKARMNLHKQTIQLDGKEFDISPGEWPSDNDQLDYESLVFRQAWPALPQKSQLVTTIASGNDRMTNSLVLTVDGHFELRSMPPFNPHDHDPGVVVRHETFSAGNGYVGPGASTDARHIDEHYASSLHAWRTHLETGKTQIYSDYVEPSDPVAALDSLRSRWTPGY